MPPLGNPEEQAALSITDAVQTVTISNAASAVEFQNTQGSDVYFGKASTLTSARGGIIYSGGNYKKFEDIPSGWKISFRCASGQTATLRQINYV